MRAVQQLRESVLAVLGLTALAALLILVAGWGGPLWLVGLGLLVLVAGIAWVGARRPSPVLTALTAVGYPVALVAQVAHDQVDAAIVLAVAAATCVALVDDPLRQRLAPGVRAVHLPGVPSDPRPDQPGPFALVLQVGLGTVAVFLILEGSASLPSWGGTVVLIALVALMARATAALRAEITARRGAAADDHLRHALAEFAPQFYLYFSGPVEGEYQLRMWLPYLERIGVRYAILSREPKLLPRAAGLTDAPVVLCQRLAALDAVMVPSVRAVFYVNTHAQCADPVRYLDRTHVHLNHGDSDKPSSYHPMIGMFDQIFVAGQAAIDRFARHGVVVPQEKFVTVGRPQVADVAQVNVEPLPEQTTVLYAPTWRGGLQEMSFSSLPQGERIVRALLGRGVRVMFRPHPFSLRERSTAQVVTRIDALLSEAGPPGSHLTSEATANLSIIECFNRSDALVTDVSSVASDYLQSGKPFAVVDMGAAGGRDADATAFPILRGAYVLDAGSDVSAGLADLLETDPQAAARAELRTAYLGDHADPVEHFVRCAAAALRHADPANPGDSPANG